MITKSWIILGAAIISGSDASGLRKITVEDILKGKNNASQVIAASINSDEHLIGHESDSMPSGARSQEDDILNMSETEKAIMGVAGLVQTMTAQQAATPPENMVAEAEVETEPETTVNTMVEVDNAIANTVDNTAKTSSELKIELIDYKIEKKKEEIQTI